ncbi:MAG: 50S ribosomal protein L11 methyltransferase, partial [Lentisphaeria bacterium]|nr:50S ribosomal protein L11 methyltransferase [Lentisphaeria bacterium]
MSDLLYCCTIRDQSECPDAAAELLSGLGYEVSSWKNAETKEIHLTLYFQEETACREAIRHLKEQTEEFASFGIVLNDLTFHTLKKEDWAEVWKLHFKPLIVSDRLAFAPSWEKFQPKPGQLLITLDPGMSFGTGQHATTKFCLSSLDRFILERKQSGKIRISMLDAGSGSGILAIAARKLGCAPVDAFDIDPDTISIAQENALINGIKQTDISFRAASLLEYDSPVQYDLVAANILSSALIAGRDKLLSFCHPGTRL